MQIQGLKYLSRQYESFPVYDHFVLVSFSKPVFSQGAVNQIFVGLFDYLLDFFHSKIWVNYHFGTFVQYKQEKEKSFFI